MHLRDHYSLSPERFRFKTLPSLVLHRWAACLSTYLVKTPLQQNFAPSCISSRMASSPSRSMVVALRRSMTSVRPSRELPALLHVVRSSATHGLTRVPSTTNLRSRCVSIVEILNMYVFRIDQLHGQRQTSGTRLTLATC